MMRALIFLAVLSTARAEQVAQGIASKQKGNSMIAKVIEMLGEEKDKIKADLAAEEKTMDEYMQWCDDTQTEFSYSIKSGKAKIADLSATITDNTAQIAALDEELEELGNEIASRTSEMEEAIAIRTKEHEIFLKSEAEQVATVEELEAMGVALKKQIAAFTATPPPVTEEPSLVQTASASPAATFDAFLQINRNSKKSGDESEAP